MARFYRSNAIAGATAFQRVTSIILERTPSSILDVGCGTGEFWVQLQQSAKLRTDCHLTLCDQSPALVRTSVARVRPIWSGCVSAHSIDLNEPILPTNHFDVVTVCQVLHHLQRPKEAMNRLLASLEQNGIVIATTCHTHHMQELYSILASVLKIPYRVARGLSTFDESAFVELLSAVGRQTEFEVIDGRLIVTDLDPLRDYVLAQPTLDQLGLRENPSLLDELVSRVEKKAKIAIEVDGAWKISLRICLGVLQAKYKGGSTDESVP